MVWRMNCRFSAACVPTDLSGVATRSSYRDELCNAKLASGRASPSRSASPSRIQLPVSFTITTALGTFGSATFDFDGSITARASARGGDANFDGNVNLNDFNTLAGNFGATGAGWLQGDFTFDGNVNLNDFNVLAANFGMSASANGPTPGDWNALGALVPEPGSLALLSLAMLPALRRRRKE